MCGEKFSKSTRKRSGIGSPPRVRGKVLSIPAAGGFAGITPACAGKRKYSIRLYELIWDHPRVCGEKYGVSPIDSDIGGSPPRVRGKGADHPCAEGGARITPACAGKSVCVECVAPERKDHPRVCGEKLLRFLDGKSQAKDHPRVCGEKYRGIPELNGGWWITPACAGKSKH